MLTSLLLFCFLLPILTKMTEKCSKCGPNEVDTSKDKCLCEWELSCEAPIPGGCTDKCAKRKCSCKPGFYRNRDKKCVAWKDCPKSEFGPCAAAFCAGGVCEDIETECGNPPCPLRPECKPVPSTATVPVSPKTYDCSNFICGRCDDYCTMVNEAGCFLGNCTIHPECLPKSAYSCLEFEKDCKDGTVCRMIPVQCYTCPCYPLPHCVPPGGTSKV